MQVTGCAIVEYSNDLHVPISPCDMEGGLGSWCVYWEIIYASFGEVCERCGGVCARQNEVPEGCARDNAELNLARDNQDGVECRLALKGAHQVSKRPGRLHARYGADHVADQFCHSGNLTLYMCA